MGIIVYKDGKFTRPRNPGRQMDGENMPGDLDAWDYMGTDPNEILTYTYDVLSQRSTTLYHTHGPVAAAINKQTNYAIGPGLFFRSQPDWEILGITKEAAKEWGMRFQKLVHYTLKLMNFYEKQSVLFRTALIQGDSLLLFDRTTPENGLPFDLIETGGDQIDFEKTGTTLGVYTDSYLRRQGLALPSGRVNFKDKNGDQNILQFFLKLMGRQVRGYSLHYRMIAAAKNNSRLWDSILARSVMESNIFANIVGSSSPEDAKKQAQHMHAINRGNVTGSTTLSSSITNTKATGSGNVWALRDNGKIEITPLQTPSSTFAPFQLAYFDLVGMATDTPPEVVASKYSTSFTAAKGALNDFIKSYMAKRTTFERTINDPVIREIAKYLILSGMIEAPAPGFFDNALIQAATLAGKYLGPVPGHINPLQEVTADEKSVQNMFELRGDIASKNGNELENMSDEWLSQEKIWQQGTPEQKAKIIGEDIQEQDEKELDEEKKEGDEKE